MHEKISITDRIAAKHLGKRTREIKNYDPFLLVVVPRQENRTQYNIDSNNLPFKGCDVWHAYEFSSMTEKGLPITRLLKIKYPCDNELLVESKSLKLYLNSFNMMKFGKDTEKCLEICKDLIEKTLSKKLKTNVEVSFFDNSTLKINVLNNYKNLLDMVDEQNLFISKFSEAPEELKVLESTIQVKEYRLTFDSLRSNCRVTHQPDFGDVFIYYKSHKHIQEDSLIKYLTSFRNEFHFHEECCEMIYKRLSDLLNVNDELMVCALYTRRGGIDISPIRYSKNCKIDDFEKITDMKIFARNGVKQ